MPIHVKCGCGGIMWASDSHAGKTGQCPSCGATVRVPIPTAIPTAIPDILSDEAEPSMSATASMPWYWRFMRGAAWVPLGAGCVMFVVVMILPFWVYSPPTLFVMALNLLVGCGWLLAGACLSGSLLLATDAVRHLKEIRDKTVA